MISSLLQGLSDIQLKNSPYQLSWTPTLEEKVYSLRSAVSREPMLVLVNSNMTFVLRTDSSNTGLGAVRRWTAFINVDLTVVGSF